MEATRDFRLKFSMKLFTPIFAFFTWVLLSTGPVGALTFDEARHLLARTGFGLAPEAEIKPLMPLTHEEAVDRILETTITEPVTSVPKFRRHPTDRPKVRKMDGPTRNAHQKALREDRNDLRFWWIREMLATPSPLTERMVLFWHNHFVSEANKVQYGQWLYSQNAIFRKFGLGDFRKLLIETSIDPAMMIYLDANKNKRNNPNENFAREILELFTLGEGHVYTEEDIRESARAYTGWRINAKSAEFEFRLGLHDNGVKNVLGESGTFDGIDVIDIILKQPRVGEFIAEKLWREFVSLNVDRQEVKRIGALLHQHKYQLKPVLKAILMSEAFRDPANRGSLVKSPVELTIGTLRFLGLTEAAPRRIWNHQRRMGQNLLDPPDVKGWRGGLAWITSTSTLGRNQFLSASFRGVRNSAKVQDMAMINERKFPFGMADSRPFQSRERREPGYLKKLMLAVDPVMNRRSEGPQRVVFRNILLDPAYQVK